MSIILLFILNSCACIEIDSLLYTLTIIYSHCEQQAVGNTLKYYYHCGQQAEVLPLQVVENVCEVTEGITLLIITQVSSGF